MNALSQTEQELLENLGLNQGLIEALGGEKVSVRLIKQRLEGEDTLRREVELLGQVSGKIYCTASSQIMVSALPPSVREGLLGGDLGLGQLITEAGMDTRREILQTQTVSDTQMRREYIIYSSDTKLAHITETFNRTAF